MKVHQTAGAVLFNQDLDKVFLIHKKERDEWLLPKGHIEDGESVVDTAKREVYEETGYKKFVILGSTPVVKNEFEFEDKEDKKAKKIIALFTAILTSNDRDQTEEMKNEGLSGAWWPIEEAVEKAAHDDIREAIKKANEQVRDLSNNI